MNLHKSVLSVLIVLLGLLTVSNAQATAQKRVLMVLSGYGQEQGSVQPGYEFDEFSKAYLVFNQNGLTVDIASPQGGEVEADKYDPEKPYNALVLKDAEIMAKLDDTLALSTLQAQRYDAIFIVGGKGAMFDLPKDQNLQSLIADIYQQQGVVAAVCHGPAALVDVKLANGKYLVANKAVNGFTNQEEQLFGKKWLPEFEFLLQDKLIERGGKFQSADIMLNHVAVDERLITGQNPSSTISVAQELVKALGIAPTPMQSFRDDRTLDLVAKFLAGDSEALQVLASDEAYYHLPLAGMYGYYYQALAETDSQLHNSLKLMQVAQKVIANPQLDMQIAQTQHKLGDNQAALTTLHAILATNPEFEPAKALVKTLTL
ncbi:type 1 glutamine amidotransferase domain-containing protein [Planctobacterium marinum]|uniref:type 1 glutamine amidotransferase domain-containing protein n=1 Tax=Planctobacterium marinum TaxID=1631968 RepID=UPI001E3B6FE4|nr:type 1 glutamine amidotransferase domain-containing protein [Planctobacterium marinum]MCC2605681.1 type 1 glutamine amidotransferase domain-containing protein [Planctobacterium marinum]